MTSGNLLVFAGPSGGHLFPAFSFAEAFYRRCPKKKIYLITSQKARRKIKGGPACLAGVFYLPDFPFYPEISLRAMRFLLQLPRAFAVSLCYLQRLSPELCVGFGSYASLPGVWLASRRRIPTLIHEQNAVAGKTTKWLWRWVDRVAVSFPETLAEAAGKRQICGFPLRRKLVEAASEQPSKNDTTSCQILVLGGSQGAEGLNRLVVEAFSRLSTREKHNFAVIHSTGERSLAWVKKAYEHLGIQHTVAAFLDDMATVYQQSDFAITRAGAGTLFELALFGLPAVVVPYPYAEAHQEKNAAYFARHGGVISEREAFWHKHPDRFLAEILSLISDRSRREVMARSQLALATPHAADRLADLALELIENNSLALTRRSF